MLLHPNVFHSNIPLCTTSASRPGLAARVAAMPARLVTQLNASGSASNSTEEGAEQPGSRTRRTRLFSSIDRTNGKPSAAAPAGSPDTTAAAPATNIPVSEEFRKTFEDLGVQPGVKKPSPAAVRKSEQAAAAELGYGSSSSSSRRRPRESQDFDSDDERGYKDSRPPLRVTSPDSIYSSDRSWLVRGRQNRSAPDVERQPRDESQRQRWIAEAEERKRLAEEAERKRLRAKERSERIPTQPKKKQDPVIFSALERALKGEWDEKMTKEELRGARASARWVARVGLYDRNKSIRSVRRKLLKEAKVNDDPEAAALAASAARQIAEAAAKSIQPTVEELQQQAAGVRRDFSKAEALPEGEWERLKKQYLTDVTQVKIGRKGASEALVGQIQAVWRRAEVVKLRIHDERSARKMNMPRLNLLLKELEERTGTGVVINADGASIWLYRGVDYVPPPKPVPYQPPPLHEQFTQQHTPRGHWRDIAGVSCYVVSSKDAKGLTSPPSTSSSSGSSAVDEHMAVLLLPDQFPMADMPIMLQMADRVASKGALVVLPDLLGPEPSKPHSNLATKGKATAGRDAGYWRMKRWPLVKKRKLEYFDWYSKGPGSWDQQKPRLMGVLQEMQQQGMYTNDSAAAAAAAAAAADGELSSSSSSSSSGNSKKPLGILGVGWGNYIAFHAAGDDDCVAAGIQAIAAMSPVTFVKDTDLATALQLPVALLPAKYDPMEQMMMTIDLLQRPYAPRCIFKRFGKVRPGWAHWLPQWQDTRAMYQAAEQLLLSIAYLKRELLGIQDASIPPPLVKGEAAAAVAAAAAAAAEEQQQQDGGDDDQDEDEE